MRQMSLARLAAGWLLGLLLLLLCLKLDGVMDSWVWCAGRLTNYPYSIAPTDSYAQPLTLTPTLTHLYMLPHPLLSVGSSCRSSSRAACTYYLLSHLLITHHNSLLITNS